MGKPVDAALFRRLSPNEFYVGVDLLKPPPRHLRELFKKTYGNRFRFITGSGERLPLEDKSADEVHMHWILSGLCEPCEPPGFFTGAEPAQKKADT